MQRICFQLRVKPSCVEQYRDKHRQVWPEMREALSASGWHNYTLFLDESGLLTGYLECDNFTDVLQKMAALEVNDRWQAEVADLFEGTERIDRRMLPVEEVFHLD